jgi:hypothetical protein
MQNKFSVKQNFEEKFSEIFSNNDFGLIDQVEYGFHSIDEIEENSLLFIGLNPSRITDELPQGSHFYNLRQKGNDYPKYWKAFEEFGEATSLTWTHLDLLVVRETNQEKINDIFRLNNGIDFIYQQLMISKQIIEAVKPRIIVIANTLSRLFIGRMQSNGEKIWIGYEFEFDESLGTDKIVSEGPLNGVPVFFTSMLNGQRALDLGSKQRLIWHIKRVNEMIK